MYIINVHPQITEMPDIKCPWWTWCSVLLCQTPITVDPRQCQWWTIIIYPKNSQNCKKQLRKSQS